MALPRAPVHPDLPDGHHKRPMFNDYLPGHGDFHGIPGERNWMTRTSFAFPDKRPPFLT